jgi:hypothetical protein
MWRMNLKSMASRFLAGDKSRPARDEADCRRIMKRVPQRMKYGYIWCDSLITPRACMVKDLSVGGAKISNIGEEIKPRLLANNFRFFFCDEKHEIICSLAWIKGQTMGIKFESRPLKPSRTYKPI